MINTDNKYDHYRFIYINIVLLGNISQIATGMPYSESLRTIFQSGPNLINIGWNLTCFGPIQSLEVLGWRSSLQSLGCSQKLLTNCTLKAFVSYSHVSLILAPHPRSHFIIISIAFSSRSHLTLIAFSFHSHLARISLSSHFRHVTQVRWCKISSINRMNSRGSLNSSWRYIKNCYNTTDLLSWRLCEPQKCQGMYNSNHQPQIADVLMSHAKSVKTSKEHR
jgi:hypothetical protein